MHLTISKNNLAHRLGMVVNAAERKTTIPILATVMIKAESGRVSFAATDLEVMISTSCEAEVKEVGAICVPAKRLYDYIRLLPDADVTLKTSENGWLSLSCGRSKTRIAGDSLEQFPEGSEMPEHVAEFPSGVLSALIRRTTYAVSAEESRFTLNGCLFERFEDGLRMVATDGHRLALSEVARHGGEPFKHLIPKRALIEYAKIAASTETNVKFAEDANNLYFDFGDTRLTARILTGKFPDYDRVLPKDLPISAVCERDALKAALTRAKGFADERSASVKVVVDEGRIDVFASTSETGNTEESVEAVTDGKVEVAFNAKYLLEYLGTAETPKVRLKAVDPTRAGQLEPVDSPDRTLCVVMPMRL